ncbi:collagen-like protein [Microbispora sp. NEAU-D428]|uniref:collagen-like protein n=1 Tax=Microbispora sitophila TaxID=2771537 RepID=UPI0018682559|nr:collagen-like protein [Microbispora sitophila]MBE3012141.1 collagen-like protein [Microbispora sitophila]
MRRKTAMAFLAAEAVAITGVAAGGVAFAGQRAATIHACVASSGTLRLVKATQQCRSGERRTFWNQAGPQGRTGPQGPAGAQGPVGARGATGPAGRITGYALVSETRTATGGGVLQASGEAVCPSGKKVVGGGGAPAGVDARKVVQVLSAPTSNGEGWTAAFRATEELSPNTLSIRIWAICADVSS